MVRTLNRLPDAEGQKAWCAYRNDTRHIQVVRIENIPRDYFERVIFPGSRIVFQASSHAWLDIYTGELSSALLAERILCDRLKIELAGHRSSADHYD